jgi:protease-4
VWTGVEAHARGLVDELGGFDVALHAACERAKRPDLEAFLIRPMRFRLPPLPLPTRASAVFADLLRERALTLCEIGMRLGDLD